MSEFKVGDRVKILNDEDASEMKFLIGKEGKIVERESNESWWVQFKDLPAFDVGLCCNRNYNERRFFTRDLELIQEAKLTIRERIEALKGWDKEADDLLKEIGIDAKLCYPRLVIPIRSDSYYGGGAIHIENNVEINPPEFKFNSQCEKLRAFKDALLWLTEKAGLLKDEVKQKEISELKKQIEEINEKIKKLEG